MSLLVSCTVKVSLVTSTNMHGVRVAIKNANEAVEYGIEKSCMQANSVEVEYVSNS